ncbi:unnamed protein product [Sphagnum jensenii]|uniref:Uncharacterized protein n=1 Tax=Sphagnum jensenii TaxID=128206 RepID=A0ABP1AC51_9BRYO
MTTWCSTSTQQPPTVVSELCTSDPRRQQQATTKRRHRDVNDYCIYIQESKEPGGLDKGRSGAVLCSLLAYSSGNWRSTDD